MYQANNDKKLTFQEKNILSNLYVFDNEEFLILDS